MLGSLRNYYWSMFALGFFCFGGVALQASALYLCAIILPLLAAWNGTISLPPKRVLIAGGCCLLGLYGIFCFSNIYNFLFFNSGSLPTPIEIPPDFRTSKLFASRFSSGVGISGVVMLLIAYFFPILPQTRLRIAQDTGYLLFAYGLLVASVWLLLYVGLQHFTGFDYRASQFLMPTSNTMGDGRYRAMGAFGHPLSLASASLAIAIYSFQMFRERWHDIMHMDWRHFYRESSLVYLALCTIHLTVVLLTGARAALVILFLLMIFLFLRKSGSLASSRLRMFVAILVAALFPLFLWWSGLHHRFLELWNVSDPGAVLGERREFWQVYARIFWDHPWLGAGAAELDQFLRLAYYQALGLGDFARKYNAHNVYLETLACAGVIGSCVMGLGIWYAAKTIRAFQGNFLRAAASDVAQRRAFSWALIANAVHGVTQNTFFDAELSYVYLSLFWLLLWNSSWRSDGSGVKP